MVAALHLEQRPVLGPDHMAQTSADRVCSCRTAGKVNNESQHKLFNSKECKLLVMSQFSSVSYLK